MVEVRRPTWWLRELCPICAQGRSLALVACPLCDHLVVCCEEEGTVFLTPKDLTSSSALDASEIACPGCAQGIVADFTPATDVTIRSHGFTAAEYE